jgi:hypothetical protein
MRPGLGGGGVLALSRAEAGVSCGGAERRGRGWWRLGLPRSMYIYIYGWFSWALSFQTETGLYACAAA